MEDTYPTETETFYKDGIKELDTDKIDYKILEQWFNPSDTEPKYIYWVDKPFEYVRIHKKDAGEVQYESVKIDVDDSIKQISEDISDIISFTVQNNGSVQYNKFYPLVKEAADLVTEEELSYIEYIKILYTYIDSELDLYSKLSPVMKDPNTEEVSCIGSDESIIVYHRMEGQLYSNIKFENSDVLNKFITQIAQRSGDEITEENPIQDVSLPDGSRAQLSLGDQITTHGSTFTIRKFQEILLSPVDLLKYNTFSLTQMAYLWLAIENNKSLIFAGGNASGKTTAMNAVSLFIPLPKKIVSVEDNRELTLPHKNWTPGVTKENSGETDTVDMSTLIESSIRQRPEYLIAGEIRGEEATKLFEAISKGYTVYSTIHADSVQTALNRLKNPPINVPANLLQELDIMCIQLRTKIKDDDGEWNTVRRNSTTSEIEEVYQDREPVAETNPVFAWDTERDEFVSRLSKSTLLQDIGSEQGLKNKDVREEIKKREDVLQYLLDEDVQDIENVIYVIQGFMLQRQKVMEGIKNDSLDIEELKNDLNINLNELKEVIDQTDKLLEN